MSRETTQYASTLFRASHPERELSLSTILFWHHEPELMDFVFAILKGVANGVESLIEIALHPIDNLVYPISQLLFDATIIAMHEIIIHRISPLVLPYAERKAFNELKNSISYRLYDASMQRMKNILTHCNDSYRRFEKASPLEKTEILSSAVTQIYIPGGFIRGANIVKNIAKNVRDFGRLTEPMRFNAIHRFSDAYYNHAIKISSPIKTLTKLDVKGTKTFLYVVDERGALLIAEKIYSVDVTSPHFINHPKLAGYKPVRAAGKFETVDGTITKIDNASGHYIPDAPHLKTLVENTFIRNGFDAAGKYQEIPFLGKRQAPGTSNVVPPKLVSERKPVNAATSVAAAAVVPAVAHLTQNQATNTLPLQQPKPSNAPVIPLPTVSPFANINIPLPSKRLTINRADSTLEVAKKLDTYFDDLIRNYPQTTQHLLRSMYYNHKIPLNDELNLLRDGCSGQHQYVYNHDPNAYEIMQKIVVDKDLVLTNIHLRLAKIHEIAVHAGQTHQIVTTYGTAYFHKYKDLFTKFTELSVAPCEKLLCDAISITQLQSDLVQVNATAAKRLLSFDKYHKNLSIKDYLALKHRGVGYDKISFEEFNLLMMSRDDYKHFLYQNGLFIGTFTKDDFKSPADTNPSLIERKQKELAEAKAALAERRELERKIKAKEAELVIAEHKDQEANQRLIEATAADKEANTKLIALKKAEEQACLVFKQTASRAIEAWRTVDAARKKADDSLRATGLLTTDGTLKASLLPTQLTASSSFSDAFIAIRNLRNNTELKKNENRLKYSVQQEAFQNYLLSKVGRRLPILPQILEAHPTVSTADEFYALAQQYIKGDKAEKHFSLVCLHMTAALNPNNHNVLCSIGAIYFSNPFGTQEAQTEGIKYLKLAREKGNAAATKILNAMPSGSTTPDNDGEGQRAAVAQGAAFARIANSIRNAINNGRFDLHSNGYSDRTCDSSSSNDIHHDACGEHTRDWGARGGSDMWNGDSTSGNGGQWEYAGTETLVTGTTCDRYTRDGVSCYTNLR